MNQIKLQRPQTAPPGAYASTLVYYFQSHDTSKGIAVVLEAMYREVKASARSKVTSTQVYSRGAKYRGERVETYDKSEIPTSVLEEAVKQVQASVYFCPGKDYR